MADSTIDPDSRQALARFQHQLLTHLRSADADDPWWRAQLIDPISPALLGYLQAAMQRTLLARLAVYFPGFARHAPIDARALEAQVRVAVVCVAAKQGLDEFFAGALALASDFVKPPAWADLLRLERANYLWRVERPLSTPELIAALRDAEPARFDERGVDDRRGFGFVRLDTTMVDLWKVPARSPTEAVVWGPPRQALTFWSAERQTVRVLCCEHPREIALRLALRS